MYICWLDSCRVPRARIDLWTSQARLKFFVPVMGCLFFRGTRQLSIQQINFSVNDPFAPSWLGLICLYFLFLTSFCCWNYENKNCTLLKNFALSNSILIHFRDWIFILCFIEKMVKVLLGLNNYVCQQPLISHPINNTLAKCLLGITQLRQLS